MRPGLVRVVLGRDISFRADEIAADIIVPVRGDMGADEVRLAPAQDEEVLVADHPDDLVVRRRGGPEAVVQLSRFVVVGHGQPRRRMPVRPVELDLHPDRVRKRRVVDDPAQFHGVPGERGPMDELDWPLGVLHPGHERLLDEILGLLGLEAAHPVGQGYAQARQVLVFVDDLGDALAHIAADEGRSVLVLLGAVGGGEFGRNHDVPIDDIGFDAALFGHAEQRAPERLPVRQFFIGKGTGLGKVRRADHDR